MPKLSDITIITPRGKRSDWKRDDLVTIRHTVSKHERVLPVAGSTGAIIAAAIGEVLLEAGALAGAAAPEDK